jgi:hypothetical protein
MDGGAIVVAACAVLLGLGLAASAGWGGRRFVPPPVATDVGPGETARRFGWYASLALTGGVIAGVTIIGAGGRLAMRLLAITSGNDAQGRITEAEEVVGDITVDGSIGFIVFFGIIGGALGGALYLMVRRFLPAGRIGGAVFGLGLLIVLGTTVDPLRKSNPDFDLVGPGWLSLVLFSALAVAFGMTLDAVMARLSAWLPLPSRRPRVLLRYAVPIALAVFAFSITVVLILICLIVVAVTRWDAVGRAVRSHRWVVGGRVAMLGLVFAFLPHATLAISDIATR